MRPNQSLYDSRAFFLIALRVAIGWHFLYEGLVKLFTPSWTASGYLLDSKGLLAPMFKGIAASPGMLRFVDSLNEWGLILIGAGLILGLLTRPAIIGGMVLLTFYYLSHPPLVIFNYSLPSEGSYFIVDKIMIEFIALGVLYTFRTELVVGIDRLLFRNKAYMPDDGKG
ncbi:MAG TPA: DoxX family protein [Bacteroidales bacterium]|nr:DoxX family protein [Bacteroidales bacterium]